MSCFHPLYGYKSSSGKWLSKTNDIYAEPMTVPCGQCTGCRSEYSRQWALRNMHEASLTPNNNSFITLTYNEKNLPQNNSLDKKAFPKFIRSLRQKNKGTKIRYYACGEYGDNFGRPHYHAILFNYFPHKYILDKSTDTLNYISLFIEKFYNELCSKNSINQPPFSPDFLTQHLLPKYPKYALQIKYY